MSEPGLGEQNGNRKEFSPVTELETGEMHHSDEITPDDVILQIGQSRILSSHVEKVIHNLVIVLNGTCNPKNIPAGAHHHPYVHIRPQDVHVSPTNGRLGAVDLHKNSLKQKITECDGHTWDSLVLILKNVASGVQHLHKAGKSHGRLSADCVSLSYDDRNHPLLWQQNDHSGTYSKEKDIQDLGKMFYFVLTNGKEYTGGVSTKTLAYFLRSDVTASTEPAETAKDLIDKMTEDDPISITEVLAHPLFWTTDEKIYFVTDIFDSLGKCRDNIRDLEKQHENSGLPFWHNWVDKLKIEPEEKDKMEEHVKGKPFLDIILQKAGGTRATKKENVALSVAVCNKGKIVKLHLDSMEKKEWEKHTKHLKYDKNCVRSEIKNFFKSKEDENGKAEKNSLDYEVLREAIFFKKDSDGGFDQSSLYHLMRFIRNRKVHCWESQSEKQALERKWYEVIGFWNFYSKRFPKLLVFLHNNKTEFPFYTEKRLS